MASLVYPEPIGSAAQPWLELMSVINLRAQYAAGLSQRILLSICFISDPLAGSTTWIAEAERCVRDRDEMVRRNSGSHPQAVTWVATGSDAPTSAVSFLIANLVASHTAASCGGLRAIALGGPDSVALIYPVMIAVSTMPLAACLLCIQKPITVK